jgi:hypothetical protein
MSEPTQGKAAKVTDVDLEQMPKVPPEAFKPRPGNLPKYKVEIVLKTSNSVMFEVASGEEAAKFVDSYQMLLERKTPVARWNIGQDLYAIPMEGIVMIRLHKPPIQEIINAQS